MQSHALLPLLGACTASYLVSFFLMENTIMTEKIARRGVFAPDSYEPDLLQTITVAQVMNENDIVVRSKNTIREVNEWLNENPEHDDYFLTVNDDGSYSGVLKLADLYINNPDGGSTVNSVTNHVHTFLKNDETLRMAVEEMAKHLAEVFPNKR